MAALNGDIGRDDGSAVGRVRGPGACASGRARGAEGRRGVTSSHTLGPAAAPPLHSDPRPCRRPGPYRNAIAGLTHRSKREVTDNRLGSAASGRCRRVPFYPCTYDVKRELEVHNCKNSRCH